MSRISITQNGITRTAAAAGIKVLLDEADISIEDVDALYLAGGFGNRLNPESAAAIGMIPQKLVPKTIAAGNTGLAGAEKALLDPAAAYQGRALYEGSLSDEELMPMAAKYGLII